MTNVVWIVLDCVRRDFLGCYGNSEIYTPTIDALAETGLKYDEHITAAPWTNPSITSMLAGRSPHKLQMFRFREKFPPDVKTFYHYLRDEGYDISTFTVSEGWFGDNDFVNEKGLTRNIDEVIDTIGTMSGDDFFLFGHYWNTHLPYFDNFSREAWFDSRDDIIELIRKGDQESIDKAKRIYQSAIERASEEFIYAVIEKLQDDGIYEETYIVVTGDHGESWGDRLEDRSNLTVFGMHGKHLYDEVLRVPLILSGPDVPSGETIHSSTRSIDVMPTLLDLLGIDYSDEIDGKPLPLTAEGDNSDRPILASTSFVDNPSADANVVSKLCYRTSDWKLIRNLKQDPYSDGGHELYNLTEDPDETNNLSSNHPAQVEKLGENIDEAQKHLDISDDANEIIKDRLEELGYFN